MTDRIRKYIGLFFDELPFSDEAARARERIEKALEEAAPDALPDELTARYGSYEKLAALAGYSAGGHIAAGAAMLLRDRGVKLTAQVLGYPFLNFVGFDFAAYGKENVRAKGCEASVDYSGLKGSVEITENFIAASGK